MITLKKQYALAFGLHATALTLTAAAFVKHKNGNNVLTPKGQETVHKVATGIAITGHVVMFTAHCRGAIRIVKSLKGGKK